MTQHDEGTMRRLKKLLTLASDPAAAPGEAANAMRMAQNLMAKFNITDGAIASSEIGEFELRSTKTATPPPWEGALLGNLCRAFGARNYWCRAGVGTKGVGSWVVLAHKPQLEMIQYAFEVLRRQLVKQRTAFIATLPPYWTRPQKAQEGDAFGLGFVASLSKKIAVYAEPDAAVRQALDAKIEEVTGGKTFDYKPTRSATDAATRGAQAGAAADVHRAAGVDQHKRLN
jgi:Protein of unknown function (DUF2786)